MRLKASSEIKRHCQQREMEDWAEQKDAHQLSLMLMKSGAPEDLPEQLWRSQALC